MCNYMCTSLQNTFLVLSGFRVNCSTDTSLIQVVNDVKNNSDSHKVSVLFLLELLTLLGHDILLQHLEGCVGLKGSALSWLSSENTSISYGVWQ